MSKKRDRTRQEKKDALQGWQDAARKAQLEPRTDMAAAQYAKVAQGAMVVSAELLAPNRYDVSLGRKERKASRVVYYWLDSELGRLLGYEGSEQRRQARKEVEPFTFEDDWKVVRVVKMLETMRGELALLSASTRVNNLEFQVCQALSYVLMGWYRQVLDRRLVPEVYQAESLLELDLGVPRLEKAGSDEA